MMRNGSQDGRTAGEEHLMRDGGEFDRSARVRSQAGRRPGRRMVETSALPVGRVALGQVTERPRRFWGFARALGVAGVLFAAGCSAEAGPEVDAGPPNYGMAWTGGNARALLHNLVGRWFPETEIVRLNDDTLTPEEWCARSPVRILVLLDEVEVQCAKGPPVSATIARVKGDKDASVSLTMRAKEGSDFRHLKFENILGTKALISGGPCSGKEPVPHARFPQIESLRRQILGRQTCAQIGAKPINTP